MRPKASQRMVTKVQVFQSQPMHIIRITSGGGLTLRFSQVAPNICCYSLINLGCKKDTVWVSSVIKADSHATIC